MNIYLCLLFLGLVSAGPLSQEFSRPLDAEELEQLENILASLEGGDDTSTATVNVYADKLLKNIDQLMKKKYEPMTSPDISQKFKKLFVTGEFTLSYGSLEGLSTIHRDGKVEVSYSRKTQKLTIKIPLTFDNLKYKYDYKIKFMALGPAGNVDGKVSNFKMAIELVVDFKSYKLIFNKYQVKNSGHISINFHGNILYDWMLTIVGNAATIALKPIILTIIETVVAGGLKSVIKTVNDLINGFLNPTEQLYALAPLMFEVARNFY